jgi:hypothetical protein
MERVALQAVLAEGPVDAGPTSAGVAGRPIVLVEVVCELVLVSFVRLGAAAGERIGDLHHVLAPLGDGGKDGAPHSPLTVLGAVGALAYALEHVAAEADREICRLAAQRPLRRRPAQPHVGGAGELVGCEGAGFGLVGAQYLRQ